MSLTIVAALLQEVTMQMLPKTKEQRDQEELERILHQDEAFRRQCPGVEAWQGDWVSEAGKVDEALA